MDGISVKVAVVVGTRPELIKMGPVVKELERRSIDFQLVHTGQHYSYEMDRVFFDQLGLPAPVENLDVGSGAHGAQTGRMLEGLERIFAGTRPDKVLVQGDTNTVLAGALAAAKMRIGVGHVEAGLRSYDRAMPEEINRIIADHISDWLFAPTSAAAAVLAAEGIPANRIFMTGNTVVDSVIHYSQVALASSQTLSRLALEKRKFSLVTIHRQENVDDPVRFQAILEGIAQAAAKLDLKAIYPIHPRARKMIDTFKLDTHGIRIVDPCDYLAFLELQASAGIIFTDSGGVQEEACILKVPCVTVRDNTERPETVEVGANLLAGASPARIIEGAIEMSARPREWTNPFGDGRAAKRIVDVLTGT